MRIPFGFDSCNDVLLQRASARYADAHDNAAALVASMLESARRYDVMGMEQILAICFWGRSGSFLLASYLDGHEHTVVLPGLTSEAIYWFFEEYTSLSIWQRLLAYPEYSEARHGADGKFFDGEFPIEAMRYYAAVHALSEIHAEKALTWPNARAGFFRLLYVAYAVARGDRGDSARPLMVYAQHAGNDIKAARLAEDFPAVRFIHTIRDPISALDSWFDRVLKLRTQYCNPSAPESPLMSPALDAVSDILSWDRPHRQMQGRTFAIRFEDLHRVPEATMRRLAGWLGIPYLSCLIESTWNGSPWIVWIRGQRLCGANPDNARRRSEYMNRTDRLMIFALLNDNFVEWNYPSPPIIRKRFVRWCLIAGLALIPMKMEWTTAKWVLRLQVIPSLRRGSWIRALRAPGFLLKRRWRMIALIAVQARARITRSGSLLRVL